MRSRGITAVTAALITVLTVLQAPSATAATASKVSLSVSSSKVTVGASFTLRAAVPRGKYLSTDVVSFQRKIGTSWNNVATRTLGSDGKAAFAVKPTVGTRYYRVVKPSTRRFARATSSSVKIVTVTAPVVPADPVITVNGPGTALSVTASDPVAKAAFTAAKGDKVALAYTDVSGFGMHGQPPVTVLDSTGSPVDLVGLDDTVPRSRWTFVVPATGSYTARIEAIEGEAGSLKIVATTPLTQTFAVNGPSQVLSASGLAGRELRAAFTATAGDYFSYDYDGPAAPRPNSVRLVDMESGELVQGVGIDPGLGMWRIPETGTYRLELEPYTAATMSGTMFVSTTTPSPMALNAPEVDATVSRPGAAQVFTLPVEEGHDFTLGVTYDAEDGNDSNYQVSVLSPDGAADVVRAPHDTWPVKAWTGGSYLLIVRGRSGYTPSIGINASTPLQRPVVVDGPDISASTAGSPGRSIETEFEASAHDIISIAVSNLTYGPTNPYGSRFLAVEMQDLSTGKFVPNIDSKIGTWKWQVPHDGRFKLVYSPLAAYTMAFDFTVLRSVPVPIAVDGPPVNASIERKGSVAAYSVKVKSGQHLVLTATPSDGSKYNVTVFGDVPMTDIYTSGSKEIIAKWDGTMTIVVAGPTSGSGAAPLKLTVATP